MGAVGITLLHFHALGAVIKRIFFLLFLAALLLSFSPQECRVVFRFYISWAK